MAVSVKTKGLTTALTQSAPDDVFQNRIININEKMNNMCQSLYDDMRNDIVLSRKSVAVDAATDGKTLVGVTDVSSPRTITISASDNIDGNVIIVADESGAAAGQPITVASENGKLLDGEASLQIADNYGVLRLYYNNVDWFTF